ncbi:MAG TPA: hypothetical protein VFQ43_11520, partial [Nitrososphaera sp.]|nr:hypothetical protein [Nitrososphaera sp.]
MTAEGAPCKPLKNIAFLRVEEGCKVPTPAASTNLNRRVIKAWEKSYGKPANSQQRFYQALLQELWRTHPGGGN